MPRKTLYYRDLPESPGDRFIACVNPLCGEYGQHYSATRGDYWMALDLPVECGGCEEPMILAREQKLLIRVEVV